MPEISAFVIVLFILAAPLSLLVFQGITGVPSVSSSRSEAAAVVVLLQEARLVEGAIVYDLGCGWGSLVIALARAFPNAQIRGIEISPFPYWVARLRTCALPNVYLQRANFHSCDLQHAQAVTCYLMAETMPKLANLLDSKLKPGTPVVSLMFWFRKREFSAVQRAFGIGGAAALYHWPARRTDEF